MLAEIYVILHCVRENMLQRFHLYISCIVRNYIVQTFSRKCIFCIRPICNISWQQLWTMTTAFLYLLIHLKFQKHCVKSVQIWNFSGPYFPPFALNTEVYAGNLRIQSNYGNVRTRKNSAFGHISRSESF